MNTPTIEDREKLARKLLARELSALGLPNHAWSVEEQPVEELTRCDQAALRAILTALSLNREGPTRREGFAPCPTCGQYSHSIGDDQLAAAFMHFQSMYAHPLRGHPMGYNFDEKTRDAAQVLMAAAKDSLNRVSIADETRRRIENIRTNHAMMDEGAWSWLRVKELRWLLDTALSSTPHPDRWRGWAMSDEQQVEVTQADRDAAAEMAVQHRMFSDDGPTAKAIREGKYDQFSLVQAFARHRLACSAPSALPDDGKLIERLRRTAPDQTSLGGHRHVNPDGPEAATRIETLSREIERVKDAVRDCEGIESGPNGSGGMRVVAHFPVGKEPKLFSLLCSLTTGSAAGQDK